MQIKIEGITQMRNTGKGKFRKLAGTQKISGSDPPKPLKLWIITSI